jgi:hypothetical protein
LKEELRLKRLVLSVALLFIVLIPAYAQQKTILFDAKHAQTAGNADWTLDEDSCGVAQRYPTPDQAGITASTAETYWSGAFSAMGVDLVKKGFHVESLPTTARISYGDTTNAQDLANYNVFVIPEPNVAFTSAEITAIRSFVQNGGGLFMIADHAGADRNNDGIDAAGVFNQLMGSPSIFGIVYNDNSADKTYGWFDNHPDDNYTNDTTSPIVWTGAFGAPSAGRGLGLFGSSSMTISGAAKGHVWKTGVSNTSTIGVTFATSTYGTGRIAAVADSSTGEDATNGCSHTTYLGYNDPSYDNGLIYANAVAWLANGDHRARERRDGERHRERDGERLRQRRRDEGRVLARRRAAVDRHGFAVQLELGHDGVREQRAFAGHEGVRRRRQRRHVEHRHGDGEQHHDDDATPRQSGLRERRRHVDREHRRHRQLNR